MASGPLVVQKSVTISSRARTADQLPPGEKKVAQEHKQTMSSTPRAARKLLCWRADCGPTVRSSDVSAPKKSFYNNH
jgi:hypothetical protein